jgi:hypothetical protein
VVGTLIFRGPLYTIAASVFEAVIKTAVPTKAEQARKYRLNCVSSCSGRLGVLVMLEFDMKSLLTERANPCKRIMQVFLPLESLSEAATAGELCDAVQEAG